MSTRDKSLFRNVDLDIYSRSDLQPLVAALGNKVIDLFVGRVRRTYEVHLELAVGRRDQSPTSIILGFCRLIRALPPEARALWKNARTRSFDIGIEAPKRNSHFWSVVSLEAVRAAAEVGAQVAMTVYGPMRVASKTKTKRSKAPSQN